MSKRNTMALQIQYEDDGQGVRITASSELKPGDIIDANLQIYSESKIELLRWQIIDFSDVSNLLMDSENIHQLANQDIEASSKHPGMLLAIVAPQPELFGLARMWETFVDDSPCETMIFKNRKDAEDWIQNRLLAAEEE